MYTRCAAFCEWRPVTEQFKFAFPNAVEAVGRLSVEEEAVESELVYRQVETNYAAFQTLLPSLLREHRGKHALMRDGEIVEFFDTARDAYVAGRKLFDDNLFSIQQVTDTPVDLGFFSHAVPLRNVRSCDGASNQCRDSSNRSNCAHDHSPAVHLFPGTD